MYVLVYNICLSLSGLLSLCIIDPKFIHLIRTNSNTFIFIAEWYSTVHMYHDFCIHSSVDEHLGCFHVLLLKKVLQWTLGYMHLFNLRFSQGICPVVGFWGQMVVLFLIFKGISILFSMVAVSIYISTNSARMFPFLHILPSIYCL